MSLRPEAPEAHAGSSPVRAPERAGPRSQKTILFVHGRDFKPRKQVLLQLWSDALWSGIDRDYPDRVDSSRGGSATGPRCHPARIEMAYYGTETLAFLTSLGREYREAEDVEDRRRALERLRTHRRAEFLRPLGERAYWSLPGSSRLAEHVANVITGPLALLGLGERALGPVAPDLVHYWNPDLAFGSDVRWQLTRVLRDAILADEDILVVGHSLGAMIAYDVLWKFSHYAEYRHTLPAHRVALLTLGSPLADETTKKNLKGSRASGSRRYPTNVSRWWNVAAVGDYIAHDPRVGDDFAPMRRAPLSVELRDYRIFNLALRGGRSNPHHALGYLIHPTVTEIVAEWLGIGSEPAR